MIPLGILLPSSVLQSGWFQTLASSSPSTRLIYAALALRNLIPRRRT